MATTETTTKIKIKKHKTHRKWVTCWVKWNISPEGENTVQLLYWRKVIHSIDIHAKPPKRQLGRPMSYDNVAAKWWACEQAIKEWARKQGFEVIKEKLYDA